jgi:hypothetical protein
MFCFPCRNNDLGRAFKEEISQILSSNLAEEATVEAERIRLVDFLTSLNK